MVGSGALIFHMTRPFRGYQQVWHCMFDLLIETLSLAISFKWYVVHWTFIFHISVSCDDHSMGTNRYDLVTLVFNLLIESLNLGSIFWMACKGLWCCTLVFWWQFLSTALTNWILGVWPIYQTL
jgi:hypothetical protein